MSYCDQHGAQLHPDDLAVPDIAPEDAWAIVALIDRADQLPAAERKRLIWAVLDAHVFGPALGGGLPPVVER